MEAQCRPIAGHKERRPGPVPTTSRMQAQALAHGPDKGAIVGGEAAQAATGISIADIPEVVEVEVEVTMGGRLAPPVAAGAMTTPPVIEVPPTVPTLGLVMARPSTTPRVN